MSLLWCKSWDNSSASWKEMISLFWMCLLDLMNVSCHYITSLYNLGIWTKKIELLVNFVLYDRNYVIMLICECRRKIELSWFLYHCIQKQRDSIIIFGILLGHFGLDISRYVINNHRKYFNNIWHKLDHSKLIKLTCLEKEPKGVKFSRKQDFIFPTFKVKVLLQMLIQHYF